MTSAQRVIKYLAMAFALFLVISILSGIISAGYSILRNIGIINYKESKTLENLVTISDNVDEISSINIDIKAVDLKIEKSDKFEVKTNNQNIKCSNKNGKIDIKENRVDKYTR